jgi:membrane fusion protein, copper/silver efflux system
LRRWCISKRAHDGLLGSSAAGRGVTANRLALALAAAVLLAGCGGDSPESSGPTPAANGELQIPQAALQKLGVRTARVEIGPLAAETVAVGAVRYDASTLSDVYAPTGGWVENLAVHAVGEPVHAGDLLLELYSPSLATVDEQYLSAVAAGMPPATNPYSGGLRSIGLTENMIDDLRAKKRAPGRIPFRATRDGVVTELGVRDGAVVPQGTRLLQSVALDNVWVELAIPESAAAEVVAGAEVSLTTPAFPGRSFAGRVELVNPRLDERTRTLGVRVAVANDDAALKLNMLMSGVVKGAGGAPVAHVPNEAVIRGAQADRVIVALGDGRFAPRPVVLGHAAGDRIAVLQGLAEGEQVVTSGVFLLDSETNLRSGLGRLEGVDAAPPAPHEHHH